MTLSYTEDLIAEQFQLIAAANDDDRLAAFREVAEQRDDMVEVVEAMEAEVEANNQ